jgi:phosphoglucosamine mutase
VDPELGLLDGDDFLWILGRDSQSPVVGTIMSNGGLETALGERLLRSKVGDRHVAAVMEKSGAPIGAEPSGHVLFSDGMPTGDGLYAALRLLAAMPRRTDGSPELAKACAGWTRWAQAQKNIRFESERMDLKDLTQVESARSSGARVVVRYSGTEPVLRIMVEGTGTGSASPEAWVQRIAEEFSKR